MNRCPECGQEHLRRSSFGTEHLVVVRRDDLEHVVACYSAEPETEMDLDIMERLQHQLKRGIMTKQSEPDFRIEWWIERDDGEPVEGPFPTKQVADLRLASNIYDQSEYRVVWTRLGGGE